MFQFKTYTWKCYTWFKKIKNDDKDDNKEIIKIEDDVKNINNIKHKEGSVTPETEKENEIENDIIYCDDDVNNLLYSDKKPLHQRERMWREMKEKT